MLKKSLDRDDLKIDVVMEAGAQGQGEAGRAAVFGTWGSQVQILPLRPASSKQLSLRGLIWGTKLVLHGLAERCPPKAEVRGSNPFGRAMNTTT